jgi:FkbM family methyltransferase
MAASEGGIPPAQRRMVGVKPSPTDWHSLLERESDRFGLRGLRWLVRHPVRSLYPDPRALQRSGQAKKVRARTFWGQELTVVFPDLISRSVMRFGVVEPELSSFMLRHLRPGMVVYDVGAHIGYFSLLAAACVGRSGAVHAFEPTPSTASVLRTNLARMPQATVFEAAVWRDEQGLVLHDFGEGRSAFNSAFAARLPGRRTLRSHQRTVRSISLDSHSQRHSMRADLVKIDTESAEHHVLAGMRRMLEQQRPAIAIEVGDIGVPDAPPSRALVDQLIALGYEAYEPAVGSLQAHVPREHYPYCNLVFLPTG